MSLAAFSISASRDFSSSRSDSARAFLARSMAARMRLLLVRGQLALEGLHRAHGVGDQAVELAHHRLLLLARALGLVAHAGLVDQLAQLGLAEPARGMDHHGLAAAGGLVLRAHGDDAVDVDLEGDLELRHALGRLRDVGELELGQALVVGGHVALALQDVDLDLGLVVGDGGEHAALAGGDRAVALDERGERAVLGLDAEGVRGDVEEHELLDLARDDPGLDGRAHGDALVGVDRAVGLLAEDLAHDLADLGGAGLPAHQQHLVDLLGLAGRRRRGSGGRARSVRSSRSSVSDSYFCRVSTVLRCLGPEASAEMKGSTISVCCAVDSSHFAFSAASFRRCRAMRSWREVDVRLALELVDQPVDDALVEVLAAQEGVAAGGAHLEQALRQLQDRDVEGAAAQVVDGDELPAARS